MIERVKASQVIGVLVGTVVVDGYLRVIDKLKAAIERAGKKSYEVLVGKLNEPKLNNFAHLIDLYCLVACRETSLIAPKAFYNMQVVTPHEILMALQPAVYPWESKIVTDLGQLLAKIDAAGEG